MPRDYRATSIEQQPNDPPPDPDARACPGKCNAAYRAAETRYETTGKQHDLDPRPGQPLWCRPCITEMRGALTDWPDLAARLQEEVDSGVSAALAEYVSGSKNQPIHQHEAESLLLDEFAEWAGSWEDTIREQRALNPRASTDLHRRPARVIEDACAFLPAHLDWHLGGRDLTDPDITNLVTDFGLELLGYHRRAKTLTGMRDPEPVRIDGVPCSQCGYNSLAWEVEDSPARKQAVRRHVPGPDGEPVAPYRPLGPGGADKVTETAQVLAKGAVTGYVYCRRCKPVFRMPPDEYERYVRQWAADPRVRTAVTPQLLAEAFGGSVPPQYAKLPA